MDTDELIRETPGSMDPGDRATPDPSSGLRRVLLVVIAVAALVIAGGGGWLLRGSPSTPGPSAVDLGFARDMITHHTQAVTMAGIERDGTTNGDLKTLAFDIETGQQFQVGQMAGWLNGWGEGRTSEHPMSWMKGHQMHVAADGRMPGMATSEQLDRLGSLTGKARDILFLQLMIHHHQGGIPMARYALDHGQYTYVRDLAQSMINAQSSEILYMEQELRELGGTPLAPPE